MADSTVQYSTVQYSTVQYSTVEYSTVQYSTVQYSPPLLQGQDVDGCEMECEEGEILVPDPRCQHRLRAVCDVAEYLQNYWQVVLRGQAVPYHWRGAPVPGRLHHR